MNQFILNLQIEGSLNISFRELYNKLDEEKKSFASKKLNNIFYQNVEQSDIFMLGNVLKMRLYSN